MLEYDLHAALAFRSDTKNTQLVLEFPKSAVLFLQGTTKIPDYLNCQLKFQDGSTHAYRVPTVKVQSYTLEEIREKTSVSAYSISSHPVSPPDSF